MKKFEEKKILNYILKRKIKKSKYNFLDVPKPS